MIWLDGQGAALGGSRVRPLPIKNESAREERESVFLSAVVTCFGQSAPTKHRVRNVSPHGACIDQADGLRAGQTVLVSVGLLEEVGATVQWVQAGQAGLKFATSIRPEAAKTRPKPTHVQQGWSYGGISAARR